MSKSAPSRPSWQSNDKKRLDKNGEFFRRLHQMKETLIQNEENNLRNAIARIENKKYGRSFMANTDKLHAKGSEGKNGYRNALETVMTAGGTDKKTRDTFAAAKGQKDTARAISMTGDIRHPSLAGESTAFGSRKSKARRPHTQHRFSDISTFNVKDKQIARIAASLSSSDTSNSYSFIRNPDHLPSIPSVGHRTSFTHKNRFKAMTWESEFSELPRMSATNSKSPHEASTFYKSPSTEQNKPTNEIPMKKKSDQELRFDVSPRDKDIFRHLNKDAGTPSPKLPTPPVNSRLATHSMPAVPKIFVPEDKDEKEDCQDSLRNTGELNTAMRRLVTAHSDLASLKEELGSIVNGMKENESEATEESTS